MISAAVFAVLALVPDDLKSRAFEYLRDATIGRAELTRAEELAACANYLEEAADQYDRGGRAAIAEALRETAKSMVRARNA